MTTLVAKHPSYERPGPESRQFDSSAQMTNEQSLGIEHRFEAQAVREMPSVEDDKASDWRVRLVQDGAAFSVHAEIYGRHDQRTLKKQIEAADRHWRKTPYEKRQEMRNFFMDLAFQGFVSTAGGAIEGDLVIPSFLINEARNGITKQRLISDSTSSHDSWSGAPVASGAHVGRIITSVRKYPCVATIDVSQAFYRVGISLGDAITSKQRVMTKAGDHWYQWNVLPMGMKQSPQILNACIRAVLVDILQITGGASDNRCHVEVFVDDIIIAGKTPDEVEGTMKLVKTRLMMFGFPVKAEKTQRSWVSRILLLGHWLEQGRFRVKDPGVMTIVDPAKKYTPRQVARMAGKLSDPCCTAGTVVVIQMLQDLVHRQRVAKTDWDKPTIFIPKDTISAWSEAVIRLKKGVSWLWRPTAFHVDASGAGWAAVGKNGSGDFLFRYARRHEASNKHSSMKHLEGVALWGFLKIMTSISPRGRWWYMVSKTPVYTDSQNLLSAIRKTWTSGKGKQLRAKQLVADLQSTMEQHTLVLRKVDTKKNWADHLSRVCKHSVLYK